MWAVAYKARLDLATVYRSDLTSMILPLSFCHMDTLPIPWTCQDHSTFSAGDPSLHPPPRMLSTLILPRPGSLSFKPQPPGGPSLTFESKAVTQAFDSISPYFPSIAIIWYFSYLHPCLCLASSTRIFSLFPTIYISPTSKTVLGIYPSSSINIHWTKKEESLSLQRASSLLQVIQSKIL